MQEEIKHVKFPVASLHTADYRKNDERGHAHLPCIVCGKDTDPYGKDVRLVHLCEGGAALLTWGHPDCEESACLYGYPVGPNCWRKNKVILRPFLMPGQPASKEK